MKTEKDMEKDKAVVKENKPAGRVSKTWEAMLRLRGSLIVNDPKFLL